MELNYQESGQGFPVVFLHGLSDDSNFWDPLVPEISREYRTISIDLLGHGRSPKKPQYTMELFSEEIYSLLKTLKISKAHFIGFSLGGAVAQQMAVDHPQLVSSLVLMSSFSFVDAKLEKILLHFRKCLQKNGFSSFYDEILPLVLTPKVIEDNKVTLEEVKQLKIKTESLNDLINTIDAFFNLNLKNNLYKITQPVLLICGADDLLTPLYMARETNRLIQNSKIKILDDTSHNLLIPSNIPEIINLVLNFLEGV